MGKTFLACVISYICLTLAPSAPGITGQLFSSDSVECQVDYLQGYVERLSSPGGSFFYQAIAEIHKGGKESIPLLIDRITDCEKPVPLIFSHPLNSYIAGIHECPGFLYAYMVEMILGAEQIDATPGSNNYFMGAEENYVYWFGVLWNDGKVAASKDLKAIQKIYRQWWEKNKEKSLRELREAWKDKKKPLSGSNFYWT